MSDSSPIKLSKIPSWDKMSLEQVVTYLIDNGFDSIVNDYGVGMVYELDDLPHVWHNFTSILK
jgi:hypothetical protein